MIKTWTHFLTEEKGPQSRKYLGVTTTGLGRRSCSIHPTGRVIDSWYQSFAFLQKDGSVSVLQMLIFYSQFSIHFHSVSHFFSLGGSAVRWCRCRCGWGAAGSGEFSPFAFSRERRDCELLGGVDLWELFGAPKKHQIFVGFEFSVRTRSMRPYVRTCGVLCRIVKWMRKR